MTKQPAHPVGTRVITREHPRGPWAEGTVVAHVDRAVRRWPRKVVVMTLVDFDCPFRSRAWGFAECHPDDVLVRTDEMDGAKK